MDGGVEAAFAAALGARAGMGVLCDVRDQAHMKHALPMVRGIKTAIEVQSSTSEGQPDLFRHLLQRFQALREHNHVGLVDGRHGDRRSDVAIVVRDRDALRTLRMFVPRLPNALAPFWATVVVPSPCSMLVSRCCSATRDRTWATHACHRDLASAHVAQTVSTVVSWMAGLPWASCGTGKHFHCIPV